MGLLGANKTQSTKLLGHRWFHPLFELKPLTAISWKQKLDSSFSEKLQGYFVFQPPQGVYIIWMLGLQLCSFTLLNSKLISISALCPSVVLPPQKKQHQQPKIQSTSPIPGKKWGWFLFGLPSWRDLSSLVGSCCCRPCWGKSSEYLLIWSTILWYVSWHLNCFFPVRFAPFTIHPTKQINLSKT